MLELMPLPLVTELVDEPAEDEPVDVVPVEDVVPDVVVFFDAVELAVSVTPAIRATVTATPATAVPPPAMAARRSGWREEGG